MIERVWLAPTGRTLAVFAAGLGFAVLPTLAASLWPLWLGYCAAVLAACGADWLLSPRGRELRSETDVPAFAYMDSDTVVRLRFELPVARPVTAEVTIDTSTTLEPVDRFAVRLGPEGGVVDLPLRPRRRGRARLKALWVRYPGPLGLMRSTVRLRLDRVLDAVPNIAFVRSQAIGALSVRDAVAGLKIERYTGDGTDFHALRAFAPGLDTRTIDWKASGRHTRLLAREYRAERNHPIVLALDTGRLMAEPMGGVPLLDHAIHSALQLAYISLRHGDRIGIHAFDAKPRLRLAPRSGLRAMPALLQVTSRLAYSSSETNFTLGLTDLATQLHRRSLVVVLTDFVDSVTAELMVENLLRLARRHLVVFVAFRDPLLESELDREPRRLDDVDRIVVVDTLVREREVVIRRLRRAGILVIDCEPRQVGPRLIDRYLDIKRRERI